MLHLFLAICSSAMISILMRVSSDRVSGKLSMLAANYLVCSVLGAAYAGFRLVTPQVPGFSVTVGLGIFSGILFLAGFVLFQENTRRNGVVLSAIFMKLGLLVPMVISLVFFRERLTVTQAAGFCIAVGSIVLINLKQDSHRQGFRAGLLLLLLMGGGADAMAKVFDALGPAELSDQFLFYTFAVAFLLCLILILYRKERPGLKELLFGALIGVPNFLSSKFLLRALTKLPAVVVYPSFSVATILIVTLAGVAVFREKLSRLQWLALTGIIAALILLNI